MKRDKAWSATQSQNRTIRGSLGSESLSRRALQGNPLHPKLVHARGDTRTASSCYTCSHHLLSRLQIRGNRGGR